MKAAITVRSDLAEWPRLRDFAENFAGEHGVADEERARLLIVLEELLTNLVKFGYAAADASGQAEIGLSVEGDRLIISFADDGREFNPLTHTVAGLDAAVENRPVGGLGIHLIRSFAEEASYVREGGRNRLTLARSLRRRGEI